MRGYLMERARVYPSCALMTEVPCISDRLRAPESARERRLADRIALAGTGIAGCPTLLANPVVALIIAEDVMARTRCELRPASLERPFGSRRRGSGHTGNE